MNKPCAVTVDLSCLLAEQDHVERKDEALEAVAEELTQTLLSCKVIHVNRQEWTFDDVLVKAFETDEFTEVCKLLALAGDDDTRIKEASNQYQALIAKSAREVADNLAEDALREQSYDLAGGF